MPEGAGRNYVRFDRQSGQRIAAAVLKVERGNRDQPPITFNPALGGAPSPKQIRMAKFTGAWGTGTSHLVTFQTTTSTPNTVMAYNEFVDLPAAAGTAQTDIAIGKDGTAWYLISWPDTGGPIKKGTYTPPWDKGNTKSVTVGGSTYTATNYANSIGYTGSDRTCFITQVGSEWVLINTDNTQVIRGQFTAPWVKYTSIAVTAIDGQVYQAYNPYGTAYYNSYGGENTRQCAIAYVQYASGYRWEAIAMECTA
jgi:hypothetical protein